MRLSRMMTRRQHGCPPPERTNPLPSTSRLLAAGLAAVAIGAAGCTAYSDVTVSRIYLHGDEKLVVSGTPLLRDRELNQYECAGDMVLICAARGAVTECECAMTTFGFGGFSY